MWSNISAPKSGLKAAQVGHQLLQRNNQENGHMNGGDSIDSHPSWSPGKAAAANGSPLMRYKHAVCASTSSGFIYIHGGRFGNGVPLDDDVWRFDPHANAWQQLRTSGCKPPSLQEHTLVEHQGQLYLFGGQVSAASGQENTFWRLDLATGEWFSLNLKSSMKYGAYLGPANRRGHSACIYRNSIYIFGGYEDFRGSTNQLWQYDLLNERWELRNLSSSSACHPEARHSHTAIVHQDSMYVYGGLSNLKPLGDLWRWSWRDKRWFRERTRGKSPGPLHGHSAIQAFGSMFVFGGERQSGRTTRSLWRLNLSNLSWQKIKTKGPRPSPTTWHVAIANPMGVLDEANYLIEGGDASDLEQQQQQQQPDERLMLLVNGQHNNNHHPQSASDNCFSQSSSIVVVGTQHRQQTIPMETFRPLDNSRAANVNQRSLRPMPISHSKSSQIEQPNTATGQLKLANQSRDRTKAKRRLKLGGFLRRNKKSLPVTCGSEPQRIPISWSAVSFLDQRTVPAVTADNKRHSVEMSIDGATCEKLEDPENDAEMVEEPVPSSINASILDNLDSDIKDMFERAMSPGDETTTTTSKDLEVAISGRRDQRDATSNGASLARDSMTQSQLSSWLTGAAGPTSTQTYQTAREQLTSQSTLTITPALNGDQHIEEEGEEEDGRQGEDERKRPPPATTTSRLADVRQRRSMQHFTSQQTRRGRPKSEIVQSLIDRADVIYADHHKTLNFKLDQPHSSLAEGQQVAAAVATVDQPQPRFNSNDPLLGTLANHRMFERQHPGDARPSESKRPALDKSKRHTIHQTMTYYNLYFGGQDLQRHPTVSNNLTPHSSSGSSGADTCKDATGAGPMEQLSTSAALIGVRDGTTNSSLSTSSQQQTAREATGPRLDSELSGSLMASRSDSRTLCDIAGVADQKHRVDLEETIAGEHELMMPTGDHNNYLYDALDKQQQQHSRLSDPPTNNDNTSLSFSMIAEFEEDDMLQYSSPTEPKIVAPTVKRRQEEEDDDEDDENEYDYYEEEEEDDELIEDSYDRRRIQREQLRKRNGHHTDAIQTTTTHNKQLIAQKSTSSGYDSIRSSSVKREEHHDHLQQNHNNLNHHHNHNHQGEYSTSCSLQTNSSPGHTSTGGDSGGGRPANTTGHLRMGPQTMTVDSLHTAATATTTTTTSSSTTSGTSPNLSPPSKSLPSSPLEGGGAGAGSHKSSFASSLMSGPSRLFGKKKTKTRYWQLCMFVLGGKQQSGACHGNLNEPISLWRLYI